MREIDGCEFAGCEDAAAAHLVVPRAGAPHDAFLCALHGAHVRAALARAWRVVVIPRVGDARARVTVRAPDEAPAGRGPDAMGVPSAAAVGLERAAIRSSAPRRWGAEPSRRPVSGAASAESTD